MRGGNIFLNYRRIDTEGYARLIQKSIEAHFPGCVFRDVRSIAPGANFIREIERKLETCHVLLVLIGKDWLTVTNEAGRRRLDDVGDFVRLEIETGLRRGVPVIPVLVEGARMPAEHELPAGLKPLAHLQAVTIFDNGDDDDFRLLIRVLEQMFGGRPPRPEPPPVTYTPDAGPSPWKLFALITTLGLGGLIVLVVAFSAFYDRQPPGPTTVDSDADPYKVANAPADPKRAGPSAPTGKVAAGASLSSAGNASAGNAPAGNADEEFFDPAGTWRVTSPQNAMLYTIYWLNDDHRLRFETRTTAGALWLTGQGAWDYQPEEHVLTVSGQTNNGQGFHNTVEILGGDGGRFDAHDTTFGRIVMERIR